MEKREKAGWGTFSVRWLQKWKTGRGSPHVDPVLRPGLPNLPDSNLWLPPVLIFSLSLCTNTQKLFGWVDGRLVIAMFTHIMSLCVPYRAHPVKTWRRWYLDIIERAHANLDPVTALQPRFTVANGWQLRSWVKGRWWESDLMGCPLLTCEQRNLQIYF